MFRRLRPLLLALSLLLAQQAGIAHLTGHAAQRLREGPVPAQGQDHDCAQCVLFAALGAAPLATQALPVVTPAPLPALPELRLTAPALRAVAAYRSRAPPASA